MCQCAYCENDILTGEQYAIIGGHPMHEQCCAEYNAELYPEDGDRFECDDMVYTDEDPDYDMYDGGYWDDGHYDDDPSPYC